MNMRIPVPEEHSQRFTELAQGARLHWKVLSMVGDPAPGSNFRQVNRLYPYEKVSDRARAYLDAAFEHLLMWADFVAPFKFHPEQVTNFSLRPSYTLARAALESSAQAVWMLSTVEPLECIRRHLCLIRWDLREHAKSKANVEAKDAVHAMDEELVQRVASVFTKGRIRPPGSYLEVLQAACNSNSDLEVTVQDVERIWRAASGSAHGKYWPKLDLQTIVPTEEYEPGQFRTIMVPDPTGMVEAMDAAYQMTQIATLRFADYSGGDIAALIERARLWLGGEITWRPGADPEIVARFTRDSDSVDDEPK